MTFIGMKKRIVIISPHPGFGGASIANQNIARMIARDNEVIYIDEYLPKTSTLNEVCCVDWFPLHRKRLFGNVFLYKHIRCYRPDYVIIGVPVFAIYYWWCFLACKFSGIKIGFLFHSLCLDSSIKSKVIEMLIASTTICAQHLIYVSKYTYKSWSKYFLIRYQAKKSRIIYNAVDNIIFPRLKVREPIMSIGFVGRLSKEKNPVLFCNLAKAAMENNLPYKFLIFGDGPLCDYCKFTYSSYVEFKGYVADQNLIYNNIDLLVMTSDFENCPMTILEAKMRGIPCVAPNVGGIAEIVCHKKDGLLYEQSQEDNILGQFHEVYSDYVKYSHECMLKRNCFSFDSTSNQWNNLWK